MKTVNIKTNVVHLRDYSISASQIDKIVSDTYKKYNSALRIFIKRKLNSNNDVDDVIQEVYFRLIRHPNLNNLDLTFAFLCTIASNITKDRFRKQRVRELNAHIALDDFEIESPMRSPEQILKSKEQIDVIRKALRALSRKSRKAIILHRFRGFTYEEIGKEMGISISMARKHIVHALHRISKEVENYHANYI